ncbi:MAG: DNA-directed RNA polymerase [Candidatus Heimdallarchaeota archaeon]|nr:DNA-directed RNA polymerase [Candidatus Heimdallarchaeota archaeon]
MNGEYSMSKRYNERPPREMHKVTCADCGNETEVPFKPDGERPVYCQDCYKKRKPKRY